MKRSWIEQWFSENIYQNRLGDALAYFLLYVLCPILLTWINFKMSSAQKELIAYNYLATFISAANCVYDATNRADLSSTEVSVRKTKALIILLVSGLVGAYAFFEGIVVVSLSSGMNLRHDWIFLTYLIVAVIAIFDAGYCFAYHTVLRRWL